MSQALENLASIVLCFLELERDSMNVVSSGRHSAAGDAVHCSSNQNCPMAQAFSMELKTAILAGPSRSQCGNLRLFPKLLMDMQQLFISQWKGHNNGYPRRAIRKAERIDPNGLIVGLGRYLQIIEAEQEVPV